MCMSVMDNCINKASYGEICVHCNACGRFGGSKEDILKSELLMLMEELKEYSYHILHDEYDTLLQQKNVVSSINTISGKCVGILTELGAIKEVSEDCFDMYGLKIKFSEWINGNEEELVT